MAEISTNFKVVLLGEGEVGKTSFMFRYIDGVFSAKYVSTVRMDFNIKELTVDGRLVKLQIWDTVGQERQDRTNLSKSYIRGSNGCILLFDVTRRPTFDALSQWAETYKNTTNDERTHHFIVAGNKVDMVEQRQVTEDEGRKFAEEIGAAYFETSAKTGKDIETAFHTLAQTLLKTRHRPVSQGVSLQQTPPIKRKCCGRS